MGIYMWGYGGSGDHSCEDRIRGTCCLLPEKPELYSASPEEDFCFGLGNLANLNRQLPGAMEDCLRPGDVVLHDRPVAKCDGRSHWNVLWAWSVGPGMVSRRMAKSLGRFDAIVVTDRRSVDALGAAGLEKTVWLGPDPSFLVQRQIRPLQGAFRDDTVGLCLGHGISRFEGEDGLLFRSYLHLIQFLLRETSFHIALIPYCTKAAQNDEMLIGALARQFRDERRIRCREDGSSPLLRGDLSLCRFVVGAAGAVAAWSCGVPALCLGADPRAVGLAQELFGSWQELVLPVGLVRREEELAQRFRILLSREDRIRRRLRVAVPERRAYAAQWNGRMMRRA